MDACKYKTLYTNQMGFGSLCTGCGSVHIAYSNTFLQMDARGLDQLIESVKNAIETHRDDESARRLRRIMIPTPSPAVNLLFSLPELIAFLAFLVSVRTRLTSLVLARSASSSAVVCNLN